VAASTTNSSNLMTNQPVGSSVRGTPFSQKMVLVDQLIFSIRIDFFPPFLLRFLPMRRSLLADAVSLVRLRRPDVAAFFGLHRPQVSTHTSTTSSSSAVSPRYGTALAVAAGSLPSGARRLLSGSAASSQAPLKVLLLLLLAAALATSDRLTDRPTDRPTQTTHTRPFCPAPTTERADQVPQHAGGVQGPRHRRRRVEDHGTEGSAGICEKPVVGPHPG
jgi:hypothetical protein